MDFGIIPKIFLLNLVRLASYLDEGLWKNEISNVTS